MLNSIDAGAENSNSFLDDGVINANGAGGVFDTQLMNDYEQTSHEIQLVGSSDSMTKWLAPTGGG